MPETIIVAGALAQLPAVGGHTWVFLNFLLGFRRLGYDVLFVDRLEPGMCRDERGAPAAFESSVNVRYLAAVMRSFGLEDRWAVLYDGGRETLGVDRDRLVAHARRSALLVNVMGYLDDEDILAAAPRRALLDIDPGFGQMWQALGLHELFRGHDHYVTIGERIGTAGCAIPDLGIDWVTTKQPVVLEHWPAVPVTTGRFTTVASWRGAFGPIEYEGRTYGLRAHEFRRFMDLPRRTSVELELALDIDPADEADVRRLDENGWRRVDPKRVGGDPWRYRDYLQASLAELTIAKNLYVDTCSGWFSDRSACYLASAKPVLARDTGLEGLLPIGEGVLTFATTDEAAEGIAAIEAEPRRHAGAARAIAEECFDSDRVLRALLRRLGIE